MKKIELNFDVGETFSCSHCEEAVKRLLTMQTTRNENMYGSRHKHTGKIVGFKLTPDYNSSGVLTHWHLEELE